MVYLIGAGPGDGGLISVKGLERVKSADVIIFDHLVNGTLLNYAKPDCELIYAGKISGNHHLKQEEITALIIEKAKQNKTVARLKGGDPFVFGRGGEEAEALAAEGIDFEVIPGVSSCYSVPAYAGIPVTHRDFASSFHVITAHEKKGKSSVDYGTLARLDGTLVFLMGAAKIAEIAEKLIKKGKRESTPAAVISNGTLPNQTIVCGTLGDIADKAKNCAMPAVIVVGDVVGLHDKINRFKPSGKKILATGTETVLNDLRKAAEERNADITELSVIRTVPINYEKFAEISLSDYTYIVFSSANGVDIFFDHLSKTRADIRSLAAVKFAVVGERTAAALEKRSIYADCVPAAANSESLAAELERRITEKDRVLLLRAAGASAVLTDMLKEKNVPHTDLALYRTETDFSKREALAVFANETDYIILSSGSAAKAFCDMGIETGAKFISIGAKTTENAEKNGIKVYKTAAKPTAESIIDCILED